MYSDWDLRLASFIEKVRLEPFSWGKNDCLTFANNAVKAQRGYGFADEKLGVYSNASVALLRYGRLLKNSDYNDIIDAVDDSLTRINTNYPSRGNIVAMPQADNKVLPFTFGVSVSQYCAFVADQGLVFLKPTNGFLYWGLE